MRKMRRSVACTWTCECKVKLDSCGLRQKSVGATGRSRASHAIAGWDHVLKRSITLCAKVQKGPCKQ
jgi:hypothetical protein